MRPQTPSAARALRATFAVALSILAVACGSVGPDYAAPKADVPAGWQENKSTALAQKPADLAAWWRRLDDPVLDRLVQIAARQSLDRREALARLREARALRGVAAADRYPRLDAQASYERRAESENTQFGGFIQDRNVYTVGFDAAWEIDLWGRVRRSVEAADADLDATVEEVRDVAVSVAAETAANYVDLRTFQKRIQLARGNLALQEQTLALVRARFDAGIVRERDVAQAATIVETTRSVIPTLEVGLRAAENRLAVLLGLMPGALAAELAAARPIPVPPAEVAVGVPADLLRRRADVRQAERILAAEHARIGVAEAVLYPRLSLLGTLGLQSEKLPDLFEGDSTFFGIGPSIRWNIFDGGMRRQRVAAQDARAEQALVRWERAVLLALEETENAMTAFVHEQVRQRSLTQAATQARRAVDLAQAQYSAGLVDFQVVLDTQRALAVLEDEVAQSDATVARNLVKLYKSLGGGWEHDDPARVGAP